MNWKLGAETADFNNATATAENTLALGPWVSGGGIESSDSYKKAFTVTKTEGGDFMVNC